MTKSAVRVIVRTRPTQNFAHGVLTVKPESSSVEVFIKKKEQQGVVNNARTNYSFTPDAVLHNASQDIVYEEAARDIVSGVMHGYNGAVLAYGQTGAGKTYTMTGPLTDYKVRGVIPRAVQQVFQEIAARPEQAITVRVSFLEIYNEALFDLLAPAGAPPADLMIIDDPSGSVYCRGLTMTVAATEEDVLNLLFEGTTNRAIAEHQLNKQSSRSHCLFSLHIEQRSRVDSSDRVLASKLHLIDLAGSERVSKTHTTGTVLKEAQYINRSLSFLEQVVNALTDKGRDHVPFRQSKLTHYMKDSLGGNCRTVMLANIWGEATQIEETISTLQFAMRMMKVKTEAFLNLQSDPAQLLKKYEREIRELKQELAMHDALTGRAAVGYDEYSEERRHDVMKSVKAYVADQVPDIEMPSLRHVKEVLLQFKIYAKALIANGPIASGGAGAAGSGMLGASASGAHDPSADGDGVGDVAGSSGFGLGIAADNARPLKGIAGVKRLDVSRGGDSSSASMGKRAPGASSGGVVPDKAEAFEEFKTQDGAEVNRQLKENVTALKDKKLAQKDLATRINAVKSEIDAIQTQLDLKRRDADPDGGAGLVDEEEFAIVKSMKEQKKMYRDSFEELKQIKSEVEYLNRLVDQCRSKLVLDFEQWFTSMYASVDDDAAAPAVGPDGEPLDDGEAFDLQQMERVIAEDPESLAFHNARKVLAASKGSVASKTKRK